MTTRAARHLLRSARTAGFTLVELMVALALAAMISVSIAVISTQAQNAYNETTKKVEVYNKFRFALFAIERDFSRWVATPDLEFFSDGRGAGARRNQTWDPGEELNDRTDEEGPGVVDGGLPREFDEFASILEYHYIGYEPDGSKRVHDAYQAYFRTMTYIDGKFREANIEYKLLDPNRTEAGGPPLPPVEVQADKMADLSLFKIVRYHDFNYSEIEKPNMQFPIVRKRVEVCTNITDFRIEYTADNRFDVKRQSGFRTPAEDYADPAEVDVRPVASPRDVPSLPEAPAYRKFFGYGTMKMGKPMTRATVYRAIFGDRQMQQGHRPVRFGWEQNSNIRFAELCQGDRIFIFTEAQRGGVGAGAAQAGVAGNLSMLSSFAGQFYTVKTNIGGRLEFMEDIDSTGWQRDQSNLLYKAAFLPEAVRITLRVQDEGRAQEPRTLQRVVWVRRKAR